MNWLLAFVCIAAPVVGWTLLDNWAIRQQWRRWREQEEEQ